MSKITSWVTREDGTLVESDMKFYPGADGTYEIEVTRESIGFMLVMGAGNQFTVIDKILDEKSIQKIRKLVTVGDILVSINDQLVLNEPFAHTAQTLDYLIKGGFPRRLKFLNPKKYPIQLYMRKLEMAGKIQKDMLGFNCSFQYKIDEQAYMAAHAKVVNSRDMEWVEYLKSIGGPENLKPAGIFKPSKDLKLLVRRGIPVAYRALVWQKISLSSLNRMMYPEGYYKDLLRRIQRGELSAKVIGDIEKDVDRTFPEHTHFETGSGEEGLRRVLQAFALHNTEVGYCQSLNFIAGMMIIFMQEEDAFWLLVTVVEKLLPADYYTKSMVGTYVDQFVLAHILKNYLPKIHTSFDKNSLQLPLITVQWFMCLFVNTLAPEVTLRVWDMFLNEGCKVIFRIAAALFKLHEKQLIAVKDASDLFTQLRNIGKDVTDPDLLIATAYKGHAAKQTVKPIRLVRAMSSSFSAITGSGGGDGPPGSSSSPTVGGSRGSFSMANPRLSGRGSMEGVVPAELTGLGLAHLGPERYRTQSCDDGGAMTAAAAAIGNGSGGSVSNVSTALSSPDYYSSSSELGTPQNAAVALSSYSPMSSSSSSLSMTSPLPAPVLSPKSDIDAMFRSRSENNSRLSFEYITAEKIKKTRKNIEETYNEREDRSSVTQPRNSTAALTSAAPRRHKPGELSFRRLDIAVWRESFRPALEERHLKMEEMRKGWGNKDGTAQQEKEEAAAAAAAAVAASVAAVDGAEQTSSAPAPPAESKEADDLEDIGFTSIDLRDGAVQSVLTSSAPSARSFSPDNRESNQRSAPMSFSSPSSKEAVEEYRRMSSAVSSPLTVSASKGDKSSPVGGLGSSSSSSSNGDTTTVVIGINGTLQYIDPSTISPIRRDSMKILSMSSVSYDENEQQHISTNGKSKSAGILPRLSFTTGSGKSDVAATARPRPSNFGLSNAGAAEEGQSPSAGEGRRGAGSGGSPTPTGSSLSTTAVELRATSSPVESYYDLDQPVGTGD